MPRTRAIKPADVIAILLSVLVTAGSAWAAAARTAGGADSLTVSADGKTYVYPMDRDADLAFRGPLGDTRVVIEGGKARIVSSPCENKLCIAAGALEKGGQWAACLPNKVMIRVGGANGDTDAATF
jgi:hypothetical protein